MRQAAGSNEWPVAVARCRPSRMTSAVGSHRAGKRRAAAWKRLVRVPACWGSIVVCVLALHAATVHAGSGTELSLPTPGKKITTGLTLKIATHWVEGTGYRPVTISVAPLAGGAAPADRRLRVTLRPRSWRWSGGMPSVSTSLVLEQGQTSAQRTIAVPQMGTWGSIGIETYEEGRRCEDLTDNLGMAWSGNDEWSEAAPTMLFIDADVPSGGWGRRTFANRPAGGAKREKRPERLPDIRSLAALFITENAGNGLTYADFDTSEDVDDNGLLRLVDKLGRIDIVHPDALPTEWLQLTAVNFMFIALPDLEKVRAVPERWEALRAWLSTGPTLCVYDVGDEFRDLPELERLFDLRPQESPGAGNSVTDFVARGWAAPRLADYAGQIHAIRNVQWNNQWYVQPQMVNSPPNNRSAAEPVGKPENPMPFLVRGVEHGHLVALADANPFPGRTPDWCWLFNTLNSQDWMWYQRHGMSLHRENPQYWNLLIPGVGSAPVNSFLVLISLFVVAIGPVNYFWLQRRRRLYLLLLTVPLGAGVVTLALLTYALFSDGLGIRARARSWTRIDQPSGRTVSWSRQSYYAGLAPSAGMTFPVDAAVYPLDHRPTGRYGQPKELGRHIDWSGVQQLAQGYLNSRSTAQLLVIESRATNLRIEVDEADAVSAAPRVANRLGVEVEQLLLCASNGNFYTCDELPVGDSKELRAVDDADFLTDWNRRFADERPEFPIGFDPNQVENAAAIFGESYVWWQQVDRGLPAPTTATSVLERGLRNFGNLKPASMQPRSYIAIVRAAPNAALGIEGVAEEASFHVVSGQW